MANPKPSPKGWLNDWEDANEPPATLAPPPERAPYALGAPTFDAASTVRGAYRNASPAECAHPPASRQRDAAKTRTVCERCGLVLADAAKQATPE